MREALSGGEIKRIELTSKLLRMERQPLADAGRALGKSERGGRKVVHEILERPGRARILPFHEKEVSQMNK